MSTFIVSPGAPGAPSASAELITLSQAQLELIVQRTVEARLKEINATAVPSSDEVISRAEKRFIELATANGVPISGASAAYINMNTHPGRPSLLVALRP